MGDKFDGYAQYARPVSLPYTNCLDFKNAVTM